MIPRCIRANSERRSCTPVIGIPLPPSPSDGYRHIVSHFLTGLGSRQPKPSVFVQSIGCHFLSFSRYVYRRVHFLKKVFVALCVGPRLLKEMQRRELRNVSRTWRCHPQILLCATALASFIFSLSPFPSFVYHFFVSVLFSFYFLLFPQSPR